MKLPVTLVLLFLSTLAFGGNEGPVKTPTTATVSKSSAQAAQGSGQAMNIQDPNQNVLDKVFFIATSTIEGGYKRLRSMLNTLLFALIVIDLAAMAFVIMLKGDLEKEIYSRILQYSIWISLFMVFPDMMGVIRWLFVEFGQIAGGGTVQGYTSNGTKIVAGPTSVLLSALSWANPLWNVFTNPPQIKILDQPVMPNFGIQLVALVAYIMVMFPMLRVVVQYFITYIKFSVIIGVGAIFMPWAVWQPTRFITEKFLSSVYAHGVELMIFGFLMTIGQSMFDAVTAPAVSSGSFDMTAIVGMVIVAFIYSAVVSLAPTLAQALSSGTMSVTDLRSIMSQAAKTAAMGAAGAAFAAGTASATIAGAAGGIKGGKTKGGVLGLLGGMVTGAGAGLTRSLAKGVASIGKGLISSLTHGGIRPGGDTSRGPGSGSDRGTASLNRDRTGQTVGKDKVGGVDSDNKGLPSVPIDSRAPGSPGADGGGTAPTPATEKEKIPGEIEKNASENMTDSLGAGQKRAGGDEFSPRAENDSASAANVAGSSAPTGGGERPPSAAELAKAVVKEMGDRFIKSFSKSSFGQEAMKAYETGRVAGSVTGVGTNAVVDIATGNFEGLKTGLTRELKSALEKINNAGYLGTRGVGTEEMKPQEKTGGSV